MGNIKKLRKKYQTPSHPWQKERIVEEKETKRDYGLKNKKELWKMGSLLARFKTLAKDYITSNTEQSQKESKQLLDRLRLLGLLGETAMLNDVLTLTDKDIMERRLQTVLLRLGLARSVKQARQFIVHGHVKINGVKISSPSYLVKKSDESNIIFAENSSLSDIEHPERTIKPSAAEVDKEKEAEKKGTKEVKADNKKKDDKKDKKYVKKDPKKDKKDDKIDDKKEEGKGKNE